MSTEKRRTLFKAFVVSQFNYCPLVWMFHTKESNNRINNLHEKALRLIYQNRNLSFDELLKLDKSVSIHYRHLQYLLTEIYKVIFYVRLYVPLRYLILEYLQVLNKIEFFFSKNNNKRIFVSTDCCLI